MKHLSKDYSPLKILIRVWLEDNTNVQQQTKLLIDFEDVKAIEEYIDDDLQPPTGVKELCIIRTYTGDAYIVAGEFSVFCSELKTARQYAAINNIFSINN